MAGVMTIRVATAVAASSNFNELSAFQLEVAESADHIFAYDQSRTLESDLRLELSSESKRATDRLISRSCDEKSRILTPTYIPYYSRMPFRHRVESI